LAAYFHHSRLNHETLLKIKRPPIILVLASMATRHIMRIDLSGPAKREIGKISERFGMTQLSMMSRLVEWFNQQSDEVRAAICTDLRGKSSRDTIKRILDDMISKK
jgi:hypothetical protein